MKMLRMERKAKRLTMKELGEMIGVSESAISQYETGKREPDNATLVKLSEILGVSTDHLLGVASDCDHPKLRVKDRAKAWKSNKAGRLSVHIDTGLLDLMDIFAEEDGISVEDEIERILHEEAEVRMEEAMSAAADREFAELPPEMIYPHLRAGDSHHPVNAVSMDASGLNYSKPGQEKKPTPVTEDGLEKMFIQYVQALNPDQQQMILDQMQRMIGQQKVPSSVFSQQITDETTP